MEKFMKEFEHLKIQLEDIKRATNNFDKSKVIGGGGFGAVYEGEVSDFKAAFKRLDRKYGQGDHEFWKEIMMLSRYKHQNLISLVGFCNEGDEMILMYEHASNGSLDRHLSNTSLTWIQRIKICLDAAMGIRYLHEDKGLHQRVIHRDIKSSNILLDHSWNAKVSDMGMSRIGPANQEYTALFTNVGGTLGYLDPVYIQTGVLTKESDVYSFGVVLIEVLCGRLCVVKSNDRLRLLVPGWKRSYTDKKLDTFICKDQPMDPTCLETFSDIAYKCLHDVREQRPSMSLVVEKLEIALKFQKSLDIPLPEGYEEILQAAVDPLVYSSMQELKLLLAKGLFLNEGKTWFSLNDKGQHCPLIFIDECFRSHDRKEKDYSSRYSYDYTSRFQAGIYNTYGNGFSIRVRSQFLSPRITYMVNLVFKCPDLLNEKATGKQPFIAITYGIDIDEEKEKRISIVHIGDKGADEWLMAGLYRFNTTNKHGNNNILDLQIKFDYHGHWKGGLKIEGIKFQPQENVEFEDEYQEILEAAAYPLMYSSAQELKLLLSRGILLNKGKTWFKLNDKGQHCEMISIKQCLVQDATEDWTSSYISRFPSGSLFNLSSKSIKQCLVGDATEDWTYRYNSRFPSGSLFNLSCKFKVRVRTKFLTPNITYSVNLIFKFPTHCETKNAGEHRLISLKYKLDGKEKTWISNLANKREDNWWMVELCQFTSVGKTSELEVSFEGFEDEMWIVEEGIEFQPLEKAEHEVLRDEIEKVDTQLISVSDDTYWEKKLPDDYKDILRWSKDILEWKTKKELYSILCTGFLIKNGQEWFSLNDKGLHRVMISIYSLASYKGGDYQSRYSRDYNSRFLMGTYNTRGKSFGIRGRYYDKSVSWPQLLSPGITYMVNLVFKCPDFFKKKHTGEQAYIAITYSLKGEEEKRSSIVHIGDKREDEWLMAGLYQFTPTTNMNQSSNNTILDLQIHFKDHEYWKSGLEIEGIEFQPREIVEFKDYDQVLIDEYQKILKAAAYPPLIYRSVQELKLLLSRGVFLNRGKTWFYLNENGQNCEMISLAECLIPDAGTEYKYSSDHNSRFPEGSLHNWKCKFRTRVRAQFLSPYITYMVNLVFKFHKASSNEDNTLKHCGIGLKYKLDRTEKTFIAYLANKREDNWWMVELYQFTSDRKSFELEISFQGLDDERWIVGDGIEFKPLEIQPPPSTQVLHRKFNSSLSF